MVSYISHIVDGELVTEMVGDGEISSSITNVEEIKQLSAKTRKEIAQMYLDGEITAEQMDRWINV